jgi:hypothetical protein
VNHRVLGTRPYHTLWLLGENPQRYELDLVTPSGPWSYLHHRAEFAAQPDGFHLFRDCPLLEPLLDWLAEHCATPEQLALLARLREFRPDCS